MAVAFLLLVLTIQIGMVITARHAAQTAAAAVARRASRPEQDPATHQAALRSLVTRSVPGATNVTASVSLSPDMAVASVAFDWDPPGPRWIPVRIATSARTPRVHPP